MKKQKIKNLKIEEYNEQIKELKQKIKIEHKKEKQKKGPLLKRIKNYFNTENETYSFKETIVAMVFALVLGFFSCFTMIKIFNGGKDYMALSNDLEKLVDTYYAIVDNYYGDIDKEQLVDDAIKGMVSSVGDIYTNYSDTDSTVTFLETVTGTYEGIGCTIGQMEDGQMVVVSIFEDGPAAEAGLEEGDIILKVDGVDYSDKTTTDIAEYIKNNKKVTMLIKRGDEEEKEVTLTVGQVEMPSVTSQIYEKNNQKIGYIAISLFTSVTDTQFTKKLDELNEQGIDGLIIDVRDNGGGYLNVVTNIANRILPKNATIYQLEDSDGTEVIKDTSKESLTYPIAILTNSNSASASEILASAIKESYHGYVVGTNTYGKGTVQQTTTLTDGSMVKYTVQKWLTPDGNWINDVGVDPTNYVEQSEDYYSNPTAENDAQLEAAINLLVS